MSNARGRAHAHRTYAQEFKQQVIRETLEPGRSVSIVARRHDINANVVFGWRKQYREGKLDVPRTGHCAERAGHGTAERRRDRLGIGTWGAAADSSIGSDEQRTDADARVQIEVEIGKRRVRISDRAAGRHAHLACGRRDRHALRVPGTGREGADSARRKSAGRPRVHLPRASRRSRKAALGD